jgi:hypothetical protein
MAVFSNFACTPASGQVAPVEILPWFFHRLLAACVAIRKLCVSVYTHLLGTTQHAKPPDNHLLETPLAGGTDKYLIFHDFETLVSWHQAWCHSETLETHQRYHRHERSPPPCHIKYTSASWQSSATFRNSGTGFGQSRPGREFSRQLWGPVGPECRWYIPQWWGEWF